MTQRLTGSRAAAAILSSFLAAVVLTACSDSSAPTQATSSTGSPTSAPTLPEQDSAEREPVEIGLDMDGQTVRLAVGQEAMLRGLDSQGLVVVQSSVPEVVYPFLDGGTGEGFDGEPKLAATAVGKSTVTVTPVRGTSEEAEPLLTIEIEVTP